MARRDERAYPPAVCKRGATRPDGLLRENPPGGESFACGRRWLGPYSTRCGDARASPPWPQPKSLAAGPHAILKQALSAAPPSNSVWQNMQGELESELSRFNSVLNSRYMLHWFVRILAVLFLVCPSTLKVFRDPAPLSAQRFYRLRGE